MDLIEEKPKALELWSC